jgi:hypothetical protein
MDDEGRKTKDKATNKFRRLSSFVADRPAFVGYTQRTMSGARRYTHVWVL